MSVEGSHPLETVAADGTGWQYKGKEEEEEERSNELLARARVRRI